MGLHASNQAEDGATLAAIVPYIGQGELVQYTIDGDAPFTGISLYRVRLYMSPSDPSFHIYPDSNRIRTTAGSPGDSSYAVNMVAFGSQPNLVTSLTDGTSNTIAISEHYARCGVRDDFTFNLAGLTVLTPPEARNYHPVSRRATFADQELGDVVPSAAGQLSPTKTFQIMPAPNQCDGSIPQSLHPGGILAAMADGSVNVFSNSIDAAVFWALVTLAGGEVVKISY